MFGSKKNPKKHQAPPKAAAPKPSGGLNSLVHQTTLEGKINADNDFRVDGSIKGTLHCAAKVIVGPDGSVDGKIICRDAVIEGRFTGELHVDNALMVKETARIQGDVITKTLIVQPGAVFNVVCKMKQATADGPSSPKAQTKKPEGVKNILG